MKEEPISHDSTLPDAPEGSQCVFIPQPVGVRLCSLVTIDSCNAVRTHSRYIICIYTKSTFNPDGQCNNERGGIVLDFFRFTQKRANTGASVPGIVQLGAVG